MLTFKIDPESPQMAIDVEVGSRWQVSSETALGGRLRDSQLPALIVTSAFVFGWCDYFRLSETYAP